MMMLKERNVHFEQLISILQEKGFTITHVDLENDSIIVASRLGLYTLDDLNEVMNKLNSTDQYTVSANKFFVSEYRDLWFGSVRFSYDTALMRKALIVKIYPDTYLAYRLKDGKFKDSMPMSRFRLYSWFKRLANLMIVVD